MKKNTCIFCNSTTKRLKYNLPTFHHFGFKTISNKIFFRKCLYCLLIFNPKKISNKYFNEKKYYEIEKEDHILQKENKKIDCSGFANYVVDKIGAGDAMLAITSLCFKSKINNYLTIYLGSLAGAHSVQSISNSEPVKKSNLLKIINHQLTG